MNDNVATQIDGLAHITHGADNHWYNGFKEEQWGGNFGVRAMDVTTIPPIVARGVMIDVAGQKGVEALPKGYEITVADLEAALRAQNVDVTPGTVALIRTGTARYWGENGSDHAKIADPDTAGIGMAAARWLVEQKGALMIGSDTSGLEYVPPEARGLAGRRRLLQPGPRLSAGEPGRPHRRVPQPRTPRRRPRLRIRLCGNHQRHPRHRRRHCAPPDGAALNRGRGGGSKTRRLPGPARPRCELHHAHDAAAPGAGLGSSPVCVR